LVKAALKQRADVLRWAEDVAQRRNLEPAWVRHAIVSAVCI
jgi:hypothetical protein